MKCVCLVLALVATMVLAQEGTPLDEDKRRFVLPSEANPKSERCKGYDYYLEQPRANGTQFIDRQYFMQGSTRHSCPPGVYFSISADLCVCSTHVRSPFLFNRDRCVTIVGSAQNDKFFNLNQRGELSSRDVAVGGYEDLVGTTDNCYGSNSTVYRSLYYMSANSISRRDLDITIGFKIPTTAGIGREFQIFGTSPCAGDSRPGSFVINYVSAAFNQQPQLTASFLVRDKTAALGAQETSASVTCSIPPNVNNPLGNTGQYFWDAQDPSNKVSLSVDMNDFSTLKLSLYNSQMDSIIIANGGFCQNNVVNFPLGRRGGGSMIAERNCPAFLGKAPGNDFMCVFDVSLKRDCIEQLVI